jgi:hypothetical protein
VVFNHGIIKIRIGDAWLEEMSEFPELKIDFENIKLIRQGK